jgi:hypothetical protein
VERIERERLEQERFLAARAALQQRQQHPQQLQEEAQPVRQSTPSGSRPTTRTPSTTSAAKSRSSVAHSCLSSRSKATGVHAVGSNVASACPTGATSNTTVRHVACTG